MIERPYYLNQLLRAKDTDFIKIITGIRRSGKSTLLEMLKKHLLTQGVPENHVIHISYEQIPWFPLEKAKSISRSLPIATTFSSTRHRSSKNGRKSSTG